MKISALAAAAAFALCPVVGAHAQIIVSGNDGKLLRPGQGPEMRTSDNVTIIDISGAPKVLTTLDVPASLLAPPTSTQVAPDGSFALVTSSQKLNTDVTPAVTAQNDVLTVIDLANPAKASVVQTLRPGMGAGAVAISPDGKLALVVVLAEDAVAVYSIAKKQLTLVDKITFNPKSLPGDVDITPDGKTALVTLQGENKVARLAINGTKVTKTGNDFTPGMTPNALAIVPGGTYAVSLNVGGRNLPPGVSPPPGPRMGTATLLNIKTGAVSEPVDVDTTPENVSPSPDGRFVQISTINGSSAPPTSANFHENGVMRLFRIDNGQLVEIDKKPTGKWCQGGVWSPDGKRFFLQCAALKQIEVYNFDGKSLNRDEAATLTLPVRPGSLGAAWAR